MYQSVLQHHLATLDHLFFEVSLFKFPSTKNSWKKRSWNRREPSLASNARYEPLKFSNEKSKRNQNFTSKTVHLPSNIAPPLKALLFKPYYYKRTELFLDVFKLLSSHDFKASCPNTHNHAPLPSIWCPNTTPDVKFLPFWAHCNGYTPE